MQTLDLALLGSVLRGALHAEFASPSGPLVLPADAELQLAATRLSGGACQDNFRVQWRASHPSWAADREPKGELVFRSDAPTSLPGSLRRDQEYAVIKAVRASGVRTPHAFGLTSHRPASATQPEAFGYFMEWSAGTALGRKVVRAPEFVSLRTTLAPQLAEQLARIHAVPQTAALRSALGPPPADVVRFLLATLRRRLLDLHGQRPACALIVRWLEQNVPRGELAVVLLHGDFRTGNFMLTPDKLENLLDWEFARWGSIYEDLAWISLRDWRFGERALPIGGFAARAQFYAAYTKHASIEVDLDWVRYFEIIGNLSWALASVAQGERYSRGGQHDLEYVAIGRRVAEMEFEALRLMAGGPLDV